MKKLIIAFIAVTLAGCSTPEKKAQKLIAKQLKETLHDWSSYEPVKFSQIDSVYTTVLDDVDYLIAYNHMDTYQKRFLKTMDEVNKYLDEMDIFVNSMSNYGRLKFKTASDKSGKKLEEAEKLKDSIMKYKPIVDSIELYFTPAFKGWAMTHSFRCNNAGGNKTIHYYRYFFDENITAIIGSKDVGSGD